MLNFFSRVRSKISNSYWLRSGSYTFLSKVSGTLFAFANFYFLIRVLPKEDFGAWVLFGSVSSFMELIKHGFIRSPLVYYLTRASEEESPEIQTASIYLNTIFGLVEIALLIFFSFFLSSFWDSPQLKSLFLIYILTTISLIPLNHLDIVQQARMHFKGTFFSYFARQLGIFIYIVTVFLFGFYVDLKLLAYVEFFSVSFSVLISFYYAKSFIKFSRSFHWGKVWGLFHYGKFTFGTSVSSTILRNTDSWMLGKMISPAAVALFNPAIRMSNLVEVPTVTLTSILFPQLVKRIEKEGLPAAKYLYEKSVGTITAIMLPFVLGILVFSAPIVWLIAGPGFEQTVGVMQITMLFGLIIPFNRMCGVTLEAIGKAKINFSFVIMNTVINAVSNFFYISRFGVIGAAYGTLTTYLIVLVYNQIYLHVNLNVSVINVFRYFLEFYSDLLGRISKTGKGFFGSK